MPYKVSSVYNLEAVQRHAEILLCYIETCCVVIYIEHRIFNSGVDPSKLTSEAPISLHIFSLLIFPLVVVGGFCRKIFCLKLVITPLFSQPECLIKSVVWSLVAGSWLSWHADIVNIASYLEFENKKTERQ